MTSDASPVPSSYAASLFPLIPTDLTQVIAQPYVVLPPGMVVCIWFVLAPQSSTTMLLAQVSMTQDFSIRAWVSVQPEGASISPTSDYTGSWSLGRRLEGLTARTQDQPPAAAGRDLVALPGTYVLNLLNLTNTQNVAQVTAG